MEEKIVVVIPAEGDSSETASWYAEAVVEHYGRQPKRNLTVYTYNPAEVLNWRNDDELDRSLERFCRPFWHQAVEIHAQAGLGALIACRIFEHGPQAHYRCRWRQYHQYPPVAAATAWRKGDVGNERAPRGA